MQITVIVHQERGQNPKVDKIMDRFLLGLHDRGVEVKERLEVEAAADAVADYLSDQDSLDLSETHVRAACIV